MANIYREYPNVFFHHSVSEQPNPSEFVQHCHNHFELIYVAQGHGKYIVESVEYPLAPGTVFLFRPTEYHYVRPERDTPYERYVIRFSSAIPIDAASTYAMLDRVKVEGNGVYFPAASVSEQVRAQFELLCLEQLFPGKHDDPASNARSEAMLRSIVSQILTLLSFERPDKPAKDPDALIANVILYLNEHLSEEISLEETAKHFFVSKYYLCHAFRKQTGSPIFAYLTNKRIAAAQQLLAKGVPAADVAFLVGFHDYSSFYRAYKKLTATAPSRGRDLNV